MMLGGIFVRARSGDARLPKLRNDLARFYANNTAYYEQAESIKDYVYRPLLHLIKEKHRVLARMPRVLELGAARTSFPAFLRRHAPDLGVEFLAYDINDTNRQFYADNGIDFVIGDYSEIDARGPFDLCFSTAVYEHLVEPHRFLDVVVRNLTPQGAFVIVCPKYILPGYVPPAIRWFSLWRQHALTCFLCVSNLWVGITGRPNFWICVEPSILRRPYRRDYDAIHMVSSSDLRTALRPTFTIRRLRLDRGGLKGQLLDRLMMMSVVAERRVS